MTNQERIHIYKKAIELISLLNDCEDEDLIDSVISSVIGNDTLLLKNDLENIIGFSFDPDFDYENNNEENYYE